MRDSNQQSLKDVINQMLKEFNLLEKMNEVNLVNSWEKVMGKPISRHTKDIYIQGKKLVIVIDSPSLKNELLLGRSKIVTLLNAEVGAQVINDVEIR